MLRRRLLANNLPYDAEIMYLESTGTQYIDTGFINTINTDFTIDFKLTDGIAEDRKIIGQGLKKGFATINGYWRAISTPWYQTTTSTDTNRHTAYTQSGLLYIDSTLIADRSGYFSVGTYPWLIFAASLADGPTPDGNCAKMRLYGCKIYENGTLVHDYIPVRVDTTGYLYDKVSGRLLGNSGTGDFILGIDKIDFPVTDGLLFWFDGKNNLLDGGFSQSSYFWYPMICVPELNGKCLNRNFAAASWLSNGGIVANNASSWAYSNTSPFYYLSDVYDVTFILILDAHNSGERRFIGEYVNGNYRGVFSIGGSYVEEDRYIGGWQYWSITTSNNNLPSKNLTYITETNTNDNNTYLRAYRDDVYLGSTTKTRYARPKNATFAIGGYDSLDNSGSLNGTLYSVVCYNRALTESEVNRVLNYLNNRYNI